MTSIGNYAFYNCSGLTSVSIGNSVTSIGNYAFFNCSGLTSVIIPNSVTSIDTDAFSGCSGLTSVTIGNGVTSIGNGTFSGCTGLKNLVFENGDSQLGLGCNYYNSQYTGKGLFYDCPLETLYLGRNISYDTSDHSGYSPFYGRSTLVSLTIGNSVTSIGNVMFNFCTGLKHLVFEDGDNQLSLGYHTYDSQYTGKGLFYNCPLETLYLGRDISYEASSNYGYSPFYGKSALASVTIGNSVTSISSYAFHGCTRMTSVTIGNNVSSMGNSSFYGCSSLSTVTIPNSVTSIGSYAFQGCSGLTSITIPNSVTTIGSYAFSGCSGLTSVTIGSSMTSIGNYAFQNCSGLTRAEFSSLESLCSIEYGNYLSNPLNYANHLYIDGNEVTNLVIPDNVTAISQYAFYNCSKIKSVVIPDGVTTIPVSAFYGCSRLSNVTIGSGVETIGNSAFYNCLITKIDCRADFPPTCGTDVFNMVKANCKLRVPEESVDLYRVHEAWSDFDIAVLPKPVTSISLNHSEYNLTGIGASVQLTATVLPTDADDKTVTWTSSNENVCTVNNGQVVATGTGTATVTATTTDGGLTATCAITVTQPVTGISLNYSEYALSGIGKSVLLVATVTPETATNKSVTWHSYNEAVCIVSNGMVISVGLGTAVVTATTIDGNYMAFCVVTVGEDVNTQITLSDEYSTFCSTKALDFTGVEGLKAYIASAYDTERGVLTLTRVYNVKARTGLILRGTKGETYEVPEGTGATTVANMLVGVVVDTELNPTEGRFTNFILAKDDIEGIGFYKVAHTSTLKAGKAYLQLPTDDLGSEVKGFRMMFDEDMSDGVETMHNAQCIMHNEAGAVYDLQGRRVAKPTKGIYIVNGKKTVIK